MDVIARTSRHAVPTRTRTALLTALAVGALFPVATPLAAQEGGGRPARPWTVLVAAGRTTGSRSMAGVEAQMRAGGFDDTEPGWCFIWCSPETAFPRSPDRWGYARLVAVRRQLSDRVHVAAMYGSQALGSTGGYREGAETEWYSEWTSAVYLDQSVTTTALLAGLGGERTPWVAAGPALHRASMRSRDARDDATRIGGAVAAGVPIPLPFAFFVELQGQYRVVGTADMGPFKSTPAADSPEIPSGRVNFDHGVLLLALGRRF